MTLIAAVVPGNEDFGEMCLGNCNVFILFFGALKIHLNTDINTFIAISGSVTLKDIIEVRE